MSYSEAKTLGKTLLAKEKKYNRATLLLVIEYQFVKNMTFVWFKFPNIREKIFRYSNIFGE